MTFHQRHRIMTRKLKVHKFAHLLPVVTGEEYEELKEDIRQRGVILPIVLFEGQVLDGRTRYLIACELGIDFPTKDFTGSAREALAIVASCNLHRRQLQPSQKAIVAAEIAKELQKLDGIPKAEAREAAAKVTGAAKSTIDRASRLIEHHPEEVQAVRSGEKTIGGIYGRPARDKLIPELRTRGLPQRMTEQVERLDDAQQYAFLARVEEGISEAKALAEAMTLAPAGTETTCPRCGHRWGGRR